MRPELRRSFAVGGVVAALLSTAALWAVSRGRAPGPSSEHPRPIPQAVLTGSPIYLPLIARPVTTPGPPPAGTPVPVTPPASGDWRTYLNYYRAVAHLPPLTENTAWSAGAVAHACYMVENQSLAKDENPGALCASPQGAAAAPNTLLLLKGEFNFSDRRVLDRWMQWPFHALAILDPRLQSTGFGAYHDQSAPFGTFLTGAVLDVKRGLGAIPAGVAYPITWPDQNSTVYLTTYDGAEQPDPLTSCGGFPLGAGSGLPIILQLGPGSVTPSVTAHGLKRNATSLGHCIFDETTYANAVEDLQQVGRAILGVHDAVVLIPRDPLVPGNTYAVSITSSGTVYEWSFNVASP